MFQPFPKRPRSMGQVTSRELEVAKALRNASRPSTGRPMVKEARVNNFQSGPIMDIFRIIDSVHDIYDRTAQQKIKAMLPVRTLTPEEQAELERIKKNLKDLTTNKKSGVKAKKSDLERRKKELEPKIKTTFPENDFVEDIFDFKRSYGGVYRSIEDKPFRASTFKEWIQRYLELNSTSTPTLSEMKNAWKNKFLQLAQQRNMTLFDQQITCKALPGVNLTNSKMSRTLTGNVIKRYNLILATDALKTSDTLSNTALNRVTVKRGLDDILNDTSLQDNYIVNMAQVVDPATNIRTEREYRFAFVPLTRLSSVKNQVGIKSTSYSTFYELNDTNEQFTCGFKIIVEIMNNSAASNPVIAELEKYIQSKSNADFLSNSKTTPTSFFTHVRVYVFPVFTTTNANPKNLLSVNGLCVQTKKFVKTYPTFAWQERTNQELSLFKIHNDLTGFSVDEVIKFMQMDTPKSKDPRVIKWIIRHYLDWKRMGDSFQITHMLKLSQLNNRRFVGKRNDLQGYHPYHFVSIDILAIVQAIMFNVNFVYQMNGNAFIIGNDQAGTPMSRHILQVLSACKTVVRKRKQEQIEREMNERGTNVLFGASDRARRPNNGYNSGNNNGNNNYQTSFNDTLNAHFTYNHLNQRDLSRMLTDCRSRYLALKHS